MILDFEKGVMEIEVSSYRESYCEEVRKTLSKVTF